jgi:hypothetical protein
MKFILLFFFSLPLYAFTPLDMKPGLWEFTTDTSAIMEQALAKIPEAQREMVKKMMAKSTEAMIKPVKTCQTKEMISDPEGVFKQQVASNPKMKDCKYEVLKSSKTYAKVKFSCKEGINAEVEVNVKSPTEQISTVKTNQLNTDNKIKTVGKWISSDCSGETKN